jgi:thiol-disulfide isomerase/thioredoxin
MKKLFLVALMAIFSISAFAYTEEEEKAIEARIEAMQSGDVDAPQFTFPDINGKYVSLSDFKGKWVVIDFWGSWCPWCIKGFPQLKEAYAEYSPKLEVVGVACNDTPEDWKNAVEKYQLPWVSLYNGAEHGGQVVKDYFLLGFPTKIIVNPEGKIVNITIGEDPAFYDALAGFLK